MHVANIVINHSLVSADLTDYVVYVNLAHLPSSFWSVVANGGGDIRVFKSDGTTELAREVVSCDTATDTGELHIKFAGTLSGSSNTTIQIHADGTSSEPAVTATYGRNAVWSDYVGVWHMTGTVGSAQKKLNSTGNSTFDLTEVSTPTSGDGWDGQSNGSYVLSGSNHIETSGDPSLYSAHTFSLKLNATNQSAARYFAGLYGTTSETRGFYCDQKTDGKVFGRRYGSTNSDFTSSNSVGASTWAHVQIKVVSAVHIVHYNGTKTSGGTGSALITASQSGRKLTFGNFATFNTSDRYMGSIGEARYRNGALSADWLSTEYNNQSDPSTFYTAEAVESTGTNTQINIGDTFRDVTEYKLNVGGVWKDVTEVKVNVGDTWRSVF
jgi:hypothetical protein